MADPEQTPTPAPKFDFSAFPPDTVFHERRDGLDRRDLAPPPPPAVAERRTKKERRRRIDPTTFEKQYTDDEIEFMTAMQRFKVQTGKAFPSAGEVLQVVHALGYRRPAYLDADPFGLGHPLDADGDTPFSPGPHLALVAAPECGHADPDTA